ncbi:Anti-sigma regulatory factor (Ser/Thr protein kinase) [Marinobacterium lutimaris]|uniref:Anti-sigma regulatory factor (Ser/Thr protein kinase) n=1 Tax=Marinobacterium lutimaris TaxID=568106 RepID=A0A1H5YVP2_9GAMM|nr:Anti-sigma regulatory factor (Ser/Thr protein kinase) [Marinobacterium lutimaris]
MSDLSLSREAERSLQIANRHSEIPRMSHWLEEVLSEMDVPVAVRFKFDLSANEAVTNIIDYAFDDERSHSISLRLTRTGAELCLEITDDGRAFDPLEFEVEPVPMTLEDASPGGLGVKLIRHYMDRCDYRREDGVNHLILMYGL